MGVVELFSFRVSFFRCLLCFTPNTTVQRLAQDVKDAAHQEQTDVEADPERPVHVLQDRINPVVTVYVNDVHPETWEKVRSQIIWIAIYKLCAIFYFSRFMHEYMYRGIIIALSCDNELHRGCRTKSRTHSYSETKKDSFEAEW